MERTTNIYLTNKELLSEIHKSKMTYVQIDNPDYYMYDAIVYDLDVFMDDEVCSYHYGEWEVTYIPPLKEDKTKIKTDVKKEQPIKKENPITETINNLWAFMKHKDAPKREVLSTTLITPKSTQEFIDSVKQSKAKKANKANKDKKIEFTPILPEDILTGDLNIRYMTYDHIPEDENWVEDKIKKKASDGYIKVNFPPFQMFVLENGVPRCVGLSHYKDDEFELEKGRTSEMLGMMYMKLVDKISKKGSFRNYTYLDEMKASALMQLSQVGLLFDEGRSQNPNPFAFYTTVVTNVFKRVLNNEKKARDIRDDLIEMAGHTPSHTRQGASDLYNAPEGEGAMESVVHKKRTHRAKK